MKKIYLIAIILLLSINGLKLNGAVNNDSILNARIKKLENKINSLESKVTPLTAKYSKTVSKSIFTKSNIYFSIVLLSSSLLLSFIVVWIFYMLYRNEWSRDKIISDVKMSIKNNEGRLNEMIVDIVNKQQSNKQTSITNNYNINTIVSQVIEQLKKDSNYQSMVNNQKLPEVDINQSISSPSIVEQPTIQSPSKYFFCIEPRSGGNFFYVDKTTPEFEETESVYHFEKQSENSAQFRIINDIPTMKRAISYKAELLDIACDSINGSQNTQKIITEKPGTVKKEGEKWVIMEKAKIKFV